MSLFDAHEYHQYPAVHNEFTTMSDADILESYDLALQQGDEETLSKLVDQFPISRLDNIINAGLI